jgi:C1A family cysteine protease
MSTPLSAAPQLASVRAKLESLGYTTVEGAREAARLVPGEAEAFLGHSLAPLLAHLPPPGLPSLTRRFPLGVDLAAIPVHPTAFRHMAGLLPSPPASADLRHLLGPVRDQKDRATCVGFATCAVREAYAAHETGSAPSPMLSPQYVYYECKQRDDKPSARGTYLKVAFESLEEDGVARESEWPYVETQPTPEGGSNKPSGADADAALHKIAKGAALPPKSVLELKAQIARSSCVAITIKVFPSWYGSDETISTGAITLPFPKEKPYPMGHALCVVGYRDDAHAPGGGVFVVRNSWGPKWGAHAPDGQGHGTLPFAYLAAYGKEAYCIDG